jgi:two-component system, OmpR family, KDP operon response regulator KdpE
MMENKRKVLIVDDEVQIRRLIKVSLEGHGWQVFDAPTGKDAVECVLMQRPELILLDLGLPDMDGKQVLQRIREWTQTPVIILSARDQEEEKIAALDLGANDYLTKPFGVGELMARMRVCLRAMQPYVDQAVLQFGRLKLDLGRHIVSFDGAEVRLTPIQYKLLTFLAKNAGKVLTHRQLLKEVWGVESNEIQYVRGYIGQLRQKIEPDPSQPIYIITESGIGYRMMFGEESKM